MRLRSLLGGLVSCIPGAYGLLSRGRTGGTDSAEYCYEVWFKHLTLLRQNGMSGIPRSVAELGPGDSLGIGLAALLSGVQRYSALDVVEYADTELNLAIFDHLLELFRNRAGKDRPSWPEYEQLLDESNFPGHILTDAVLEKSLSEERTERIREAIADVRSSNRDSQVQYNVPWDDPGIIENDSLDLIYSHAVLEHVNDLGSAYRTMHRWLKPGGFISHQIDFRSHGMTREWNGHWAVSELQWKIAAGRRPYLINRQPCSEHVRIIEENGFEIVYYMDKREESSIERKQLARKWKGLSDEDLRCSGAFMQAKKR